MTGAVVYVPPDIPEDGQFAITGVGYIKRRGYEFVAVVRKIEEVFSALRNGYASVIIFIRASHYDPAWMVPAEFVEEETQNLSHFLPRIWTPNPPKMDRLVRERFGTVNMSKNRVRSVLSGNASATGLDPDAIAAARRLARHFNEHGCA